MAKMNCMGKAVVFTSELKLEEIELLEKYRPEALVLKGGEDGKTPVFAVRTGCAGDVNKFGIVFADEARDGSGKATITLGVEYEGDDYKGFLADKFGKALTDLEKIEETVPGVLEEIGHEREAVMGKITIQ